MYIPLWFVPENSAVMIVAEPAAISSTKPRIWKSRPNTS
jgi:hypothetical protein